MLCTKPYQKLKKQKKFWLPISVKYTDAKKPINIVIRKKKEADVTAAAVPSKNSCQTVETTFQRSVCCLVFVCKFHPEKWKNLG